MTNILTQTSERGIAKKVINSRKLCRIAYVGSFTSVRCISLLKQCCLDSYVTCHHRSFFILKVYVVPDMYVCMCIIVKSVGTPDLSKRNLIQKLSNESKQLNQIK